MAAWSPYLALSLAFVLSPVICIATKGKYYLARPNPIREEIEKEPLWAGQTLLDVVDGKRYDLADMVHDCRFDHGPVSSLTCTLTKDCHDMCKTTAYEDSSTAEALRSEMQPQTSNLSEHRCVPRPTDSESVGRGAPGLTPVVRSKR